MLPLIALLLATPALAQPASQAALDEAVRRGTVATLAPLCGLREEAWAFDLRRAAVLDAANAAGPDDPALRAAPGHDLVASALGFAEAEALESFAEAPPDRTCTPLASSPDLVQADAVVQAFRALKAKKSGS